MKVLLDTNVYFAAIHERQYLERYRSVLLRLAPSTFLSSVVRYELLQGARGEIGRGRITRATRALERTGRVVAPTHDDWVRAGMAQSRLWDDHPKLRTKHLQNDILIACAARRIGALIVTENLRDFALIRPLIPHQTLSIEDIAAGLP